MSRSRSPRALGSVLKDVTRSLGIDGKLGEGRVIVAWEEIVGPRIAREVTRIRVRGNRLIVQISSPVWRQELHLNRQSWCRRLNEELGEELISEIVFR
jgi:predicted nucleic acid-binding Zn ribbon protein